MKCDILLVEDETDLGNVVSEYLKLKGFSVRWFTSAKQTLEYYTAHSNEFILSIIDVQLPDLNGFDLAESIMGINRDQTFFFLTARNEKDDRLKGLKIGAIDYIGKPFEIEELVLRIGNIINKISKTTLHQHKEQNNFIYIGDIKYNKKQLQMLLPNGIETSLTLRESELLEYLYANYNQVIKKNDILIHLWGNDDYFNGKSLEVFISRLRKLFKASNRIAIENIYGVGYILKING